MEYFNAFLCGGILCLIGQLLIDKTPLTPAKILVLYVVTGVVLGGAGVYQKLVDWAGSGATVPLTGFGYLLAKGVAKAVEEVIHRLHPEVEVKTAAAEGLNECRKMLRIARTGKYDGYLLEGMACPGGCIAGAGTVQPPEKSRRALEKYKAAVSISNPMDSQYLEGTRLLYENEADWDRVGRH